MTTWMEESQRQGGQRQPDRADPGLVVQKGAIGGQVRGRVLVPARVDDPGEAAPLAPVVTVVVLGV